MPGIADHRGELSREAARHLWRVDQPLQLERLQPAEAVADDNAAPWCGADVATAAVQGGAEEDQCVTRRYRRNDRVRFGKDGNVLVEVACRPQPRAAVLARERGQRPHNVDEIFEVALGPLPHVLVTMRQLRRSEEHTPDLPSLMRLP